MLLLMLFGPCFPRIKITKTEHETLATSPWLGVFSNSFSLDSCDSSWIPHTNITTTISTKQSPGQAGTKHKSCILNMPEWIHKTQTTNKQTDTKTMPAAKKVYRDRPAIPHNTRTYAHTPNKHNKQTNTSTRRRRPREGVLACKPFKPIHTLPLLLLPCCCCGLSGGSSIRGTHAREYPNKTRICWGSLEKEREIGERRRGMLDFRHCTLRARTLTQAHTSNHQNSMSIHGECGAI